MGKVCIYKIVLAIILVGVFNPPSSFAQYNILGKPGLVKIPKPTLSADRDYFKLQLAYLPERYSINNFMNKKDDELFYSFQFLPVSWLSVNFVLTRPLNIPRIGIGDRHLDLQFFPLRQEKHGINLAVIFSPMSGSSFIDHNSLIISRIINLGGSVNVEPIIGYGLTSVFRKPLENMDYPIGVRTWIPKTEFGNNYLNGVFGGVQLNIKEKFFLSGEYDSQYLNIAASAMIAKRISLQLAYIDMNQLSGYVSYRWFLDNPRSKALKIYEN